MKLGLLMGTVVSLTMLTAAAGQGTSAGQTCPRLTTRATATTVQGDTCSRLGSTAFRTAQAEAYWADRTGNFAPRSPVTRSRTTVNIRGA
jgi:hypothetical protein